MLVVSRQLVEEGKKAELTDLHVTGAARRGATLLSTSAGRATDPVMKQAVARGWKSRPLRVAMGMGAADRREGRARRPMKSEGTENIVEEGDVRSLRRVRPAC